MNGLSRKAVSRWGLLSSIYRGVAITGDKDNGWKKKYRAGGNSSEPYKRGNDNLES